jgi:hypothetical protein
VSSLLYDKDQPEQINLILILWYTPKYEV